MTNEDQIAFAKSAMALAARAPAEWDDFLKVLEAHRLSRDNQLVNCLELTHLPRHQGFALSIRELLHALQNARQLYSQLMQKGQQRDNRTV